MMKLSQIPCLIELLMNKSNLEVMHVLLMTVKRLHAYNAMCAKRSFAFLITLINANFATTNFVKSIVTSLGD